MYENKQKLLSDIEMAACILEKIKEDIIKAETDKNGTIRNWYCSDKEKYSLTSIKTKCTFVRELMLEVRKGCEY